MCCSDSSDSAEECDGSQNFLSTLVKVSDAQGAVAASTARCAELEETIAEMTANRLSKETTVGDVLDQHPEIGEEVEDEIAAMNWKH